MKKYFLLPVGLLLLIFSHSSAQVIYAQALEGSCTCDKPGGSTASLAGFKCKMANDKEYASTCDIGEACIKADGQSISRTIQTGIFSGIDLKLNNIKCEKPVLTCSCVSAGQTGGGKNGVKCKFPNGDPMEFDALLGKHVDTIYCNNDTDKCVAKTGAVMQYEGFNWVSDGGIDAVSVPPNLKVAQFSGVSCENGPPPTLPPAPSPPCKTFAADGSCTVTGSGLGDLSTKPEEFIKSIFSILLSLSGGIALLLIMKAGYQMMTSQGKPEQLQAGRDQLIAAIVGLVFLIFSFVILQVIGYDILKIPGFGG